jgi:hypothetical protein
VKALYAESHEKREELIFMGDAVFANYVRWLIHAGTPLISVDKGARSAGWEVADLWTSRVRITKAGRAVLNAEEDTVRLNGIDRWLGGVYLSGKEALWRWDEGNRTLRGQ